MFSLGTIRRLNDAATGTMCGMRKKQLPSPMPAPLTIHVNGYKVQNVHRIIHGRMKELKATAYAVSKAAEIKPQTLSLFLRGGEMRSDKLSRVLAVLRLEVRPMER